MANRLLRVALTGGIATGKSYCAERLAALGAPVIDADDLARAAVAPGTPGLAAVFAQFGPPVANADGTLNRAALAHIVFNDAKRRADLETIVHPIVYAGISAWLTQLDQAEPRPRLAVASVPLLYETGRAGDFDRVLVAACSPEQQIERLMARDHLTADEARLRLASQWPIDQKVQRADHVIDTSGTFESTNRRVKEVWERLQTE